MQRLTNIVGSTPISPASAVLASGRHPDSLSGDSSSILEYGILASSAIGRHRDFHSRKQSSILCGAIRFSAVNRHVPSHRGNCGSSMAENPFAFVAKSGYGS